MCDLACWRLVAVTAAKDYRAIVSWQVLAMSTLPCALVQTIFLTLVGVTMGDAKPGIALTGALGLVITVSTIIRLPQVLSVDAIFHTTDALRLGRLPMFAIALVRSWVWVAEGVVCALVVACLLGPPTIGLPATLTLLAMTPVLCLTALTTIGLGLAVASVSLVRRLEAMFGNVISYLLLAVSGVVTTSTSWVGRMLPLSHCIAALRLGLAGHPWYDQAAAAAAAGLPWLVIAALMMTLFNRRSARIGETA
jgi:hypothetical protein